MAVTVATQTASNTFTGVGTANHQNKKIDSIFVSVGDLCDKVETNILNPLGYVPLLNSLSAGPMRGILATAQFNIGLVGAIYHGLASAFSSGEKQSDHYALAGYSVELVVHSFANGFRAGIESASAIGVAAGLISTELMAITTLLPSIVNIAYDFSGCRYGYSKI